jgi:NAD(P)-dependent dehydrogenase (short-subunit alcohol dehydrogenase family)
MTLDDFRDAMATNYWSALYAILAVLPNMRTRGFGRIGNVVSIGGRVAAPHLLPYVTGKFALTGLTQGLRAELAKDNILVTGLYPPTMRTGGHTHAIYKGRHEAEYAWFSLSDTVPGLSISAERVARKFLRAVCDGDPEVIVGWRTYLAIVGQNVFPNEAAEALALVNRMLPGSDGGPTAAVRGESLDGTLPRLLNRAVPPGTRPAEA